MKMTRLISKIFLKELPIYIPIESNPVGTIIKVVSISITTTTTITKRMPTAIIDPIEQENIIPRGIVRTTGTVTIRMIIHHVILPTQATMRNKWNWSFHPTVLLI